MGAEADVDDDEEEDDDDEDDEEAREDNTRLMSGSRLSSLTVRKVASSSVLCWLSELRLNTTSSSTWWSSRNLLSLSLTRNTSEMTTLRVGRYILILLLFIIVLKAVLNVCARSSKCELILQKQSAKRAIYE